MKNSILYLSICALLFTSCSTDEPIEETPLQQEAELYAFNALDPSGSWDSFDANFDPFETQTQAMTDWPGHKFTQGRFVPPRRDTYALSWVGSHNESNRTGEAELLIETPTYRLHVIMETECVSVYGQTAMYGGLVTQVRDRSGNPPPLDLHWRLYFKVVDGGGTSGADQISNLRMMAAPRTMSLCEVYPADHPIWDSQGYESMQQPNFVVVEDSTN